MSFVFMMTFQESKGGILSPLRKGSAKVGTDFQVVTQLWAEMACQVLSVASQPPPWSTHYSVGWRCAPDEALDLALLSVEGVLSLRAGDDGGSCGGDSMTSGIQEGQVLGWAPRGQVQKFIPYFSHSADIFLKACVCKVKCKAGSTETNQASVMNLLGVMSGCF